MYILADENIAEVESWFGHLGQIECCPGRLISAAAVKDADMLLVRSVTAVNESLLAGSRVRFVGSCTIGVDHIDQLYLQNQGIGFAHAPGCNAEAVVDYVLAALTDYVITEERDLFEMTIGIVGVGEVGGRLQQRLNALDIRVLANDPPRQAQGTKGLVSLEQVLQRADVVCLHTPLTRSGQYPSYRLINAERLAQMKPGALLLNAGRGDVIVGGALLAELEKGHIKAVLDVWPDEPALDRRLLEKTQIATPHIAGYSLAGKLRGTAMIYQAACGFLQVEPMCHSLALPTEELPLPAGFEQLNGLQQLCRIIKSAYSIEQDDQQFRTAILPASQVATEFDRQRKIYAVRPEFSEFKLPQNLHSQVKNWAVAAGFNR